MLLFHILWESGGRGGEETGGLVLVHLFRPTVFLQAGYLHSLGLISFSEKGAGDLSPKSTRSAYVLHHLVGVRTMRFSCNLGDLTSTGCWTPNQKCVRMARGWSLVCWRWGFQSGRPGCLPGTEQGRDGSKIMPTPQRAEVWP